jgi:catechol 2,3-dioxygenase-like lactoylglutathione lyase family enzyme
MSIDSLHHCAIRTLRLEETKSFYESLGLFAGERPPFPFPGYWMYAGDQPVVHLVGIDEENPDGLYGYLGKEQLPFDDGSGAVDHLAFRASNADALKEILINRKIEYREREVPDMKLFQIFVEDPNGVTVELNYW